MEITPLPKGKGAKPKKPNTCTGSTDAHLVPQAAAGGHPRSEDSPIAWPCLRVASGALWSGMAFGEGAVFVLTCINPHFDKCHQVDA